MEAFNRISTWSAAGEPQLLSCWRDPHGCATINLWTWSSWIVANTSTSLYMWTFQRDPWGLALNLGSATMCGVIVAVILVKRRRYRATRAVRSHGRPAAEPRFIDVRVLPAVGSRHALASVSGPYHFSMYGRRSSSNVQASRGWTCRLQ